MDTTYPLTVLYDAACPVCALEMDHLRRRSTDGRLVFVDISSPGFDAVAYGRTAAQLDAEIHGQRADGQLIKGLDVLRAAYAAVGLGWVLRPTAWGPLAPLANAGYRLFARYRHPVSRLLGPPILALRGWRARRTLKRMAQCQAGACALPPQPRAQGTETPR